MVVVQICEFDAKICTHVRSNAICHHTCPAILLFFHAYNYFFTGSPHLVGVGDLYTDPQMHTVDQKEYGEANLGTKGMALFFSSHICNPICAAMGENCVEVVI